MSPSSKRYAWIRVDMYGNVVHCCADVACTSRLELMCKNKELSEFAP